MTKTKIVIMCMIGILVFSTIIFLNYDNITDYIENKKWEIANVIASISDEKIIAINGYNAGVIIATDDTLGLFSYSGEPTYQTSKMLKDVIIKSAGEYKIIAEKDGSAVYCLNKEKEIWKTSMNGDVVNVSINKNGYVAITYIQSGYKSLIKVVDNIGNELFTNYMVTTYAIDTDISDDNKNLAITQIDTEGIKVKSTIEIVDIDEKKSKTVPLGENILAIDIEYTSRNEILVLCDNSIKMIDTEGNITDIVSYEAKKVLFATISNKENPIIVKKENNGIFNNKYVVEIYDDEGQCKIYETEETPMQICVQNKTIALYTGNEVTFVNTNGKFIKKTYVKGQVRAVELYSNGKMAAILYRNRVDLIKI